MLSPPRPLPCPCRRLPALIEAKCPRQHEARRGVLLHHRSHQALPQSSKSIAISTCPRRHDMRRGVVPSRFFSSIAVLGRSYNVSLPTATQASRPETRCYLGYRYPCTRRGRQGASCAFLLLALDDQALRHTNSHSQTHGRGRGGSCALVGDYFSVRLSRDTVTKERGEPSKTSVRLRQGPCCATAYGVLSGTQSEGKALRTGPAGGGYVGAPGLAAGRS